MIVGNVISPHTPLPHVCPIASGWGIKNLNKHSLKASILKLTSSNIYAN